MTKVMLSNLLCDARTDSLALETEQSLHLSGESSLLCPSCPVYCGSAGTVRTFLTFLSCNVLGTISITWPYLCPWKGQRINPWPLPWDSTTPPDLTTRQAGREGKHDLSDHQGKKIPMLCLDPQTCF